MSFILESLSIFYFSQIYLIKLQYFEGLAPQKRIKKASKQEAFQEFSFDINSQNNLKIVDRQQSRKYELEQCLSRSQFYQLQND